MREIILRAKAMRRCATTSEAILWDALRGHRLDGVKFRRQHVIAPYIVDFCAASYRLIVEIDGSAHDSASVQQRDAQRDGFLQRIHRVLRIPATVIEENLTEALEEIRRHLQAHNT